VIDETRTNARKIHHGLDAHVKQRGPRPDARAHEDRRRADCAGRERDPAPGDPLACWTGFDLYANGPVVFEYDPVDETPRPDFEVETMTGRQEVGDRSGQAQAVTPALRE
jgi:hypothetical protein